MMTKTSDEPTEEMMQQIRKLCEARYNQDLSTMKEALGHIADLCSAIETQPTSVTNEFVENARKRAREFQESMGKEAKP